MYCTNCGFQNSEGAKFCGNCGKPMLPAQTQNTDNPTTAVPTRTYVPYASGPVNSSLNIKVGSKWASIGATLVLLCFFMPWLMVSCSGMAAKLSGWQLGTGNYGNGYQNQAQAYPALFLILLLGLIGFASLNGKRSGAMTAVASGIAGIIGLIIFSSNLGSQTNYYIQVSYEIGYYGEWLGFLILIGVGLYSSWQMSSQRSSVSPPIQ